MKRCPECRKDYLDDSLLYCLDDGSMLVQGSVTDEPPTAILSGDAISSERQTRYIGAAHETDVPNAPSTETAESSRSPIWIVRALRSGWVVSGILLLVLGGALLFTYISSGGSKSGSAGVVRYEIAAPPKSALNLVRWPSIALSPDGKTTVFVATTDGIQRLYARRRDETTVKPIPGTEGAAHPVFSPDGKWIAFVSNRALKKTTLDGQGSTVLQVDDARGISWADNDSLIYTPDAAASLFRVSTEGGEPTPVTKLDPAKNERTHRWPQVLPNGKAVIFTAGTVDSPDSYEKANIEAVDLATGDTRVLLQGASIARYSPSGHLIFARGGSLYAVDFDQETLSVSGKPQMVMQGVSGDETTGAVHFAIAADGTLSYIPGSPAANMRRLSWVDSAGTVQPIDLNAAQYNDVRISPDGSRIAMLVGSTGSGDVWVYDLARATSTRLTFNTRNSTPVWSPDGKSIYYMDIDPSTAVSVIMRKPADGSSDAEAVNSLPNTAYLKAITPDGTSAIFDFQRNTANGGIVQARLEQGAPHTDLVDLVKTQFSENDTSLSPDGRWLAYKSNESGRPEVYVRDMTGAGGRWQISTEGGEEPHWSRNMRELYYRNDRLLMSVPIVTTPTFQAGKPVNLFGGLFDLRTNSGNTYDVDPKTGRFLMMRPAEESTAPSVVVVLNWFDELRRLAATQ